MKDDHKDHKHKVQSKQKAKLSESVKTDRKHASEQKITELTADLQRVRADFENYRKRMDAEKLAALQNGEARAVKNLLPVIDTIERAIMYIPNDIAEHQWVQGVGGLIKQIDKAVAGMELKRIEAAQGTVFDPELHQAVQFEEDSVGETEVITEALQTGYTLKGKVLRPSLVKVAKQ